MTTPVPPVPAAPAGQGQTVASPSALNAIFGRVKEYGSSVIAQQKPWSEVLDRSAWSTPANVTEGLGRIKKNAAYFRVNYLTFMMLSCAVTFVLNPSSLLLLGVLVLAWIYLLFIRTAPVVINGRQLSDREKLLSMAGLSVLIICFTNIGAVFFSALTVSLVFILAHGAFREPDNLFLDDQETQPMLFGILPTVAASAPTGLAAVV